MASLDWAQACELAFLDNQGRLCLIGVTTHLPVPSLPVALRQLMVAVRVVDVGIGEELDVSVSILTPGGVLAMPSAPGALDVTVAASEFLLFTMRDIPVREEGVYRVIVSVGEGESVSLEIPVQVLFTPSHAEVH